MRDKTQAFFIFALLKKHTTIESMLYPEVIFQLDFRVISQQTRMRNEIFHLRNTFCKTSFVKVVTKEEITE